MSKNNVTNKIVTKRNAVMAAMAGGITVIVNKMGLGAFCSNFDPIGTMNKVINMFFGLLTFGGIFCIGLGVVTLVKNAMQAANGEQTPSPTKGVAELIAGIILVGARVVLTSLGVNTTMTQW